MKREYHCIITLQAGSTMVTRESVVTDVSTRMEALHQAWDDAEAAYGLKGTIVLFFSLEPNELAA